MIVYGALQVVKEYSGDAMKNEVRMTRFSKMVQGPSPPDLEEAIARLQGRARFTSRRVPLQQYSPMLRYWSHNALLRAGYASLLNTFLRLNTTTPHKL